MGITGVAMPLLSTLAALVIIVHSAEEEMSRGLDHEYRNDFQQEEIALTPLRQWRVARQGEWTPTTEPMDDWDKPKPPRRRRPGRKRKRNRKTTPEDRTHREVDPAPVHDSLVAIQYFDSFDDFDEYPNTQYNIRRPLKPMTTSETTIRNRPQLSEFDEIFPEIFTEDATTEKKNLHDLKSYYKQGGNGKDNKNQSPYDLKSYYKQDDKHPVHQSPFDEEEDMEIVPHQSEDDGITTFRFVETKVAKHEHNEKQMSNPFKRETQKQYNSSTSNLRPNNRRNKRVHRKEKRHHANIGSDSDFKEVIKEIRIQETNHPADEKIEQDKKEKIDEKIIKKEDESLSEFSPEAMIPDDDPKEEIIKEEPKEDNVYLVENDNRQNLYKEHVPWAISKEEMKKLKSFTLDDNIKDVVKIEWINQRKSLDKTSQYNQHYLTNGNLNTGGIIESNNRPKRKHPLPLFQFPSLDQIFEISGEPTMKERPIDPVSLKDILKRSNGTSLSEILHEHNLTLSDLLKGKGDALSVLKTKEPSEKQNESMVNIDKNDNKEVHTNFQLNNQATMENDFDEHPHEPIGKEADLELQSTGRQRKPQESPTVEEKANIPNIATKRRFPVRRKLRLRTPAMNNTHKSPLSRDLMANTARKYNNYRNMTKAKEWKYVMPMMKSSDSSEEQDTNYEAPESITTTTTAPEETTILLNSEYYNPPTETITIEEIESATAKLHHEEENDEIETTTAFVTTEETMILETTTTEKPKVSRLRPPASRMGLRRQAYNNRMKRKRMKQKNSTTEAPVESFFGMPNLVSSSEFIAQTQTPQNLNTNNDGGDFTTLDDFFTNEKPKLPESGSRYTRNSTISSLEIEPTRAATSLQFSSTTEETAKFEIEEILNDTRSSARLSKILMERNMTLNELVEHRERGSSHVHLADIFHNASKEPNPPEPFLSKSSIEPISKETYPLRAILEANLHEAVPKTIKLDLDIDQPHSVNIPIAMNFGNNVNENGENMGIMSLFTKLAENDITSVENTSTGHDSEGTPYITTIFAVNHTETREGKALQGEENNLKNDVLGWSHLLELMRRNQINESDGNEPIKVLETDQLVENSDGDGIIDFEDLQRLKDFNINLGTDEEINIDQRDRASIAGIKDTQPSQTKSVTVATASIVGLAMILFLLTYVAIKWKQQRRMLRRKESISNQKIPSPVFENRKANKNNCSTRSISPMLNSSNIYTVNTLDSRISNESPDYMWDSLRKPFQ